MYHLLRADEFDARRALALGFVQEVVPAGDQVDRALELAVEICECAPLAVREIKRRRRSISKRASRPRTGDPCYARKDGELGGLRGGDRFVRRASQGEVPGALTGDVARGTGRECRAAGLHRGRERLAALDLAGPRCLRGQAGAHSLGPEGHRVPEEGTGAMEVGAELRTSWASCGRTTQRGLYRMVPTPEVV